ncbi:MAG: Bifunctional NAD(P)H-hydrate repair enzyme [Bacteriovoracaceae bacterium]|nr:Bifunctional NAD(P)H-hydrate repair enzyme [Bacteriovoracaceae bacterium]
MRPFVTADEMTRLDLLTMKKLSISSFELMDRVTDYMLFYFRDFAEQNILFLCGPGNNGGDAYRLAEKLRQKGRSVFCIDLLPPHSEDCKKAKELYRGKMLSDIPRTIGVVVDGIFGVHGRSDLPAKISKCLRTVNKMKTFRMSLDVPTGVDGRTGEVNENAFVSDLTLTVGFPKSVFVSEKVNEVLGQVKCVGDYFVKPSSYQYVALENSDFLLKDPKRTGHKGLYGRCGVVGGSPKTPGAALLAAEAAHRVGAGYVTLYFAKKENLQIKVKDASFLFRMKWKMSDLKKESSLVLGCGGMPKNFKYSAIQVPAVIDADALSDWPRVKKKFKGKAILTPHPGEAAKMLKYKTADIQKDREDSLRELVRSTKQAVYLKGAPGLLKFSDEQKISYVNLSANPIFSKAGSGDVLSGILGGLLAQGSEQYIADLEGEAVKAVKGSEQFKRAVISGLVFQKELGEVLRSKRAAIASDQLTVFSEVFARLSKG